MPLTDREALEAIRDAMAGMCPAWALEWPAVHAELHPGEPFAEDYTAQDVRNCVGPCMDTISTVLTEVFAIR